MLEFNFAGRTRAKALAAVIAVTALLGACGTDPKKSVDDAKSISQLYEDAREEAAAGAYEPAIKLYEKLEARAAGTLLSQQAQLEQAYLLYRQRDTARALAVVERFLKLHPSSPAADYALYLQGLIHFNDDLGLFGSWFPRDLSERDQQASRDSYAAFRQLVDRFPESRYAPDAVARMKYIVGTLAAYEVHVARFYFHRGAYVAAVNRAQQAVQEFRGVAASEEALYLMAASYDRLGLNDLRDDALRVLKTNHPDSAWLSQGQLRQP
jgi:outer membrane protein assembly factor BamD